MKILLLRMKITGAVPLPEAPLGLLYVASVLEMAEQDVIVKDLTFDEITEAEWGMIKTGEIELVGITMLSFLRNQAYNLIRKIKEINPRVKVVVGGVHASAVPLQLVNNLPVDAVIIGEGEYTILDIVGHIQDNKDWKDIKGIATREHGVHEDRELVQDLDWLPYPAFHKLDLSRYKMSIASLKPDKVVNNVRLGDAQWVGMIASRGCPGRCTFCNAFDHWKLKVRIRSAQNLLDEIEYLRENFGVRLIAFNDDAFPINKKQCMEFCEGIIKKGWDLAWQTTTRSGVLDQEMCDAMEKSGCFMIAVGCESGSQKILNNINKHIKVADSVDTIRIINNTSIWSYALLMVGNPGETDETIKETIDFLKLAKPRIVSYVSGVMITPATKLFELAKSQGVIKDDFWIKGEDGLPYYTYEHPYAKMLEWGQRIGQAYPIDFTKLT